MPPYVIRRGHFLTGITATATTSKPLNIIPVPQVYKIINTIVINSDSPIMMTTTLLARTHLRTADKMFIAHTRFNH